MESKEGINHKQIIEYEDGNNKLGKQIIEYEDGNIQPGTESKKQVKTQNIEDDNDFIKNIKKSILLALLDKRLLTKWQYDCCMEKIKKGI